jgi:lipoate-protein ligase A
VRFTESNLANLPWVRRPSGGATLVHHHELTYALALPAGPLWHSGESWLLRMHRIITAALAELGLAGKIDLAEHTPVKHGDVLCFQQHTIGDVLCAGCKIVGSAQRKHRLALLQHGSILLFQSEYTPALPGIQELAGVMLTAAQVQAGIERTFAGHTGWRLAPGQWTVQERQAIDELRRDKYATAAWNERR